MKRRYVLLILIFAFLFSIGCNSIKTYGVTSKNVGKQSILDIGKYIEGEAIIMYEKENPFSFFKMQANSLLNDYIIKDTINFENVELKNKVVKSNVNTKINKNGDRTTLSISLVKSDKYNTKELINILKEKDWVISAEPNYIFKANSLTNDTYIDYQWALENNGQNGGTKGLDINPIATTSKEEKVIAIVDSGVDYTHQDLKNRMWINPYKEEELPGIHGYDFINKDDDPMDDCGHGTHCAGIIAGEANNNEGITGATLGAENIKIMSLKILNSEGTGNEYGLLKSYNYIYEAQQLGTNIVAINNSWGGYGLIEDENGDKIIENDKIFMSYNEIINLVGENGAISVCAAGNEGLQLDENGQTYIRDYVYDENDEIVLDEEGNPIMKDYFVQSYPAGLNSEYIITVGASDENDELAKFSNYGKGVDIAAPGVNILSTIPEVAMGFNSMLVSKEEKEQAAECYYDFESGLEGISCKSCLVKSDDRGNIIIEKEIGSINISDNAYGRDGKSLKWEFDYTEENSFNGVYNALVFENINIENLADKMNALCMDVYSNSINAIDYCVDNVHINATGMLEEQKGKWTPLSILMQAAYDFENSSTNSHSIILICYGEVGHHIINIDEFMVTKDVKNEDIKNKLLKKYAFLDGTSMATPFVSAAVAIDSNINDFGTALERKERIINSIRKTDNLENKINTKGVLDLSNLKKINIKEIKLNEETLPKEIELGKDLETYKIKLIIIYENEATKEIEVTNEMISGYDKNKLGEQEITVTYEGKEIKFKVIVIEKKLEVNIPNEYIELTEEETIFLIGIMPNTTVEEIKSKIKVTNGNMVILREEAEIEAGEGLVGTGYILRISNESEEKEYILVVKGDSNGDGKADFSDILKINKHRLDKAKLQGAYLKAGDITGDNIADFKDILKINKFRLGKIKEL